MTVSTAPRTFPQRIAVRFPLVTPITDLEPAIAVLHRCLQRGWLEGQLIDVADYRHVPGGPGVTLVGHDVDYSLTHDALTLTRKRRTHDDLATQVDDLVRAAAVAAEAFGYDGTLPVDVDLGTATVTLLDRRLVAELGAAIHDVLHETVTAAFTPADGEGATIEPVRSDDHRVAPAVQVVGPRPSPAAVIERLGGSRASMQSPWDITVEAFAQQRGADGVVVLDVREASEYETVNLGGTHIPLAELPHRLDELDSDATVLVHCRGGRRGGLAVELLRDAGFSDAWNVNGALVAWADRIDPTTPRY